MVNLLYKTRTKPIELVILELLDQRMPLSKNDQVNLFNLKKGYDGEILFDSFVEKLQCDCLYLNDLLLKLNNHTFQIDSLLIMKNIIYLLEIKNYEGDFFYESERLYQKSHSEILNPLTQLNRTESLLRQLLQSLNFPLQIQASVIFINPEFNLYQSPLDKPFIFPTQINRFIKQLNTTQSKLNDRHKELANKLVSLHIKESPYKSIPTYDYHQLQKGITCATCHSFSISISGGNCICLECGKKEIVSDAVLRSAKEFKVLFPDQQITTKKIYDWCNAILSKRRIQRILEKNFNVVGVHQWTYYE